MTNPVDIALTAIKIYDAMHPRPPHVTRAQAAAADLSRKLFGDLVEGGKGSGLVGGALTWIGKAFGFHEGGIVGESSATFSRGVPVAAFIGAQRFHGGGWPGLAPDEVPAILQKGERVLAKGEAAMGTGPTINVYVQPGTAQDVRRAAGQGAREALSAINGARRYG